MAGPKLAVIAELSKGTNEKFFFSSLSITHWHSGVAVVAPRWGWVRVCLHAGRLVLVLDGSSNPRGEDG